MEPVAYSIEDAAKVSNLPPRFIEAAITKGELPIIKANRRRVILKTTLELWLKSFETPVLWPPGIVAYDPNRDCNSKVRRWWQWLRRDCYGDLAFKTRWELSGQRFMN
jgi:hypothetical protein